MPKNRIHTLKDGRYSYSVTDATGIRHRIRSTQGETLRDFRARCDELDKQALGTVTALTFDDLFRRWEEGYLRVYNSQGDIRTTVPAYERHVKPHIGHRMASDLRRADVYSVMARMQKAGYSASMIRRARGCISRPYNWAIDTLGLGLSNPTQGLRFKYQDPAEERQPRVIPMEALERFEEAAQGTRYYRYYQVLAMTGLRPSEALGLQAKDIKRDYLEIRRGVTNDGLSHLKTKAARREIPLTDDLRQVLTDQRSQMAFVTTEGWLFPTECGQPNLRAVQMSFKRVLDKTAVWERGGSNNRKKIRIIKKPVQFTLYDFRHTFASKMAALGMSHVALRSIMGHTDISTTMKYYIDVTDQVIEEARALMAR
jgi:integrase